MSTPERWKAVASAVREQRLGLGWTQQEAAERAGVSLATWRLIESAGRDRYQDLTVRGVCRALGWPVDAFDTMLDGGDPPARSERARSGPTTITVADEDRRALPAGFARKYLELTPEEQGMVQGYLEALIDRRSG